MTIMFEILCICMLSQTVAKSSIVTIALWYDLAWVYNVRRKSKTTSTRQQSLRPYR